ncbi:exosortase system-associated protein, TIGR04073 family [Omnitrophica bacterium]|nr:exosortase system-associated protein, TIGR04073 family [Candidatus Omnitrophota bacterium]
MVQSKKVAFLLIFVLCMAPMTAFAGDGPIEKLGRGLANIVTSPVEYANSYQGLNESQGAVTTIVGTVIYGTILTVGRIIGGAYETVTFLVPLPEDYRPLMDPSTPMQTQRQIAGENCSKVN